MKFVKLMMVSLVTLSSLNSIVAQADVKLPGSVLITQCGHNGLMLSGGDPRFQYKFPKNHPVEVCDAMVVGSGDRFYRVQFSGIPVRLYRVAQVQVLNRNARAGQFDETLQLVGTVDQRGMAVQFRCTPAQNGRSADLSRCMGEVTKVRVTREVRSNRIVELYGEFAGMTFSGSRFETVFHTL